MIKLYPFQKLRLEELKGKNRVLLAWEMGTGKTYAGSEKLKELNANTNLVVCQKSKLSDWFNHFRDNYGYALFDLTNPKGYRAFFESEEQKVGIINYDLVWRRKELKQLSGFTLLLDESSLIQHETTKRAKFILSLNPENVIMLSGTPCNGTYETLWSQLKLLGWDIKKWDYWNTYVDYRIDRRQGFPLVIIKGYKRVDRLKDKLRENGCQFLKSEDVIDLPEQMDIYSRCEPSWEYNEFRKESYIKFGDIELEGSNPLTKLLHMRELCGAYSDEKLDLFRDLMESTNDRVIVFYNFNKELEKLKEIVGKPYGEFNGTHKDTSAYVNKSNGVLFAQYASSAYGLNLQQGNRIIYFTPPLSSEMFEQSKKRIHRIGQKRTCFYHYLIVRDSVEEDIYETLAMKRDYTQCLFEENYYRRKV